MDLIHVISQTTVAAFLGIVQHTFSPPVTMVIIDMKMMSAAEEFYPAVVGD